MNNNWIIDNYLKKNDYFVININNFVNCENKLSILLSQIALSLCNCSDNKFITNDLVINKPQKVFYISNSINENVGEIFLNLINNDPELAEQYNNLFFFTHIKDSIAIKNIQKELRGEIEKINPDIIIFDNINNFIDKNKNIKHVLNVFNELSNGKVKIISSYLNPIFDSNNYKELDEIANVVLDVKYRLRRYKYKCLFKRINKNNTIDFVLDLDNNDKFYII